MLLRKKQQTLRSQDFLETLEDFISEGTNHRWNRLSSKELYAYYYEFSSSPIVNHSTNIVRISMQDLINTFHRSDYMIMVHEELGIFYPIKDEALCFIAPNHIRFDFIDLLKSLNKRMTFFIGKTKTKRIENVFQIKEVHMYIPSEKDMILHVSPETFDEDDLKNLIESEPQVINHIYQDGSIMSNFKANSSDNSIPSFGKEFFIFTNMEAYDTTLVIHYHP